MCDHTSVFFLLKLLIFTNRQIHVIIWFIGIETPQVSVLKFNLLIDSRGETNAHTIPRRLGGWETSRGRNFEYLANGQRMDGEKFYLTMADGQKLLGTENDRISDGQKNNRGRQRSVQMGVKVKSRARQMKKCLRELKGDGILLSWGTHVSQLFASLLTFHFPKMERSTILDNNYRTGYMRHITYQQFSRKQLSIYTQIKNARKSCHAT